MKVFGFNFHLYGFIIALAILLGYSLVQKKAKQIHFDLELLDQAIIWTLGFGIVGARCWHVLTSWNYYSQHLGQIIQVWYGGLSIIGGILGGIVGLFVNYKFQIKNVPAIAGSRQRRDKSNSNAPGLISILDLTVFGLPFAQAFGRLANYFNQELYGWPSSLPWAIKIDPQHRLPGFEQFETFAPIFAYEGLLMLGFGLVIWKIGQWSRLWRDPAMAGGGWRIGSGNYFYVYLLYYSTVRFLLDFLRIDKTMFLNSGLGTNQVILAGVICVLLIYLIFKLLWQKKSL